MATALGEQTDNAPPVTPSAAATIDVSALPHLALCIALAKLSIEAQKNCCKLSELVEQIPVQLTLLDRQAS